MATNKSLQYIAASLVAFAVFIVFMPALHNQFVNWDDDLYVYNNIHIHLFDTALFRWAFLDFYAANWHPLTWISHALDYALWGLNPFGHHLSSVVIHALNSFLVVLLGTKLLHLARRPHTLAEESPDFIMEWTNLSAAILAGLLFGMHPIQVESVAWVAERKNVLCTFFSLLSLLSYLRYAAKTTAAIQAGAFMQKADGSYMLSIVCFLFALLSKPMAVTLPIVLLIIDWFPLERLRRVTFGALLLEKTPYFLLSAALSIITIKAQQSGHTIVSLQTSPFSDRILVSCHAILSYISKIFFPDRLIPIYPFPKDISLFSIKYLVPLVGVIAITAACVAIATRQKAWLVVWGSYIVLLLPVLGIVRVGKQSMADRYAYLPSIGLFLLVSAMMMLIAERLIKSQRYKLPGITFTIFLFLAVSVTLPIITKRQISIWENGITLWKRVIEIEPNFSTAYNNLGLLLLSNQKTFEAKKLFESAINIEPTNADALNNLAIYHLDLKQYGKAYFYAKSAISANPQHAGTYSTLGEIWLARQEYQKANQSFLQAIALDSGSPVRYFNVALSFEKLGENHESCRYWKQYAECGLDPTEKKDIEDHMLEMHCMNR